MISNTTGREIHVHSGAQPVKDLATSALADVGVSDFKANH